MFDVKYLKLPSSWQPETKSVVVISETHISSDKKWCCLRKPYTSFSSFHPIKFQFCVVFWAAAFPRESPKVFYRRNLDRRLWVITQTTPCLPGQRTTGQIFANWSLYHKCSLPKLASRCTLACYRIILGGQNDFTACLVLIFIIFSPAFANICALQNVGSISDMREIYPGWRAGGAGGGSW